MLSLPLCTALLIPVPSHPHTVCTLLLLLIFCMLLLWPKHTTKSENINKTIYYISDCKICFNMFTDFIRKSLAKSRTPLNVICTAHAFRLFSFTSKLLDTFFAYSLVMNPATYFSFFFSTQ